MVEKVTLPTTWTTATRPSGVPNGTRGYNSDTKNEEVTFDGGLTWQIPLTNQFAQLLDTDLKYTQIVTSTSDLYGEIHQILANEPIGINSLCKVSASTPMRVESIKSSDADDIGIVGICTNSPLGAGDTAILKGFRAFIAVSDSGVAQGGLLQRSYVQNGRVTPSTPGAESFAVAMQTVPGGTPFVAALINDPSTFTGNQIRDALTPLDDVYTSKINNIKPSGGIFIQTSDGPLVTATATETSILGAGDGSLIFPAFSFDISAYALTISGSFSSTGMDTLTIRVNMNGNTTIGQCIIPLETSSGVFFQIESDLTIRATGGVNVANILTSTDFTYNKSVGEEFAGITQVFQNNTTFNTEISNTLSVTAQFSSNSASNSLQTRLCTLNKIY